MRKADYSTLAAILAGYIRAGGIPGAIAGQIARELSARLAVDRAAFLRACGIE